MTYLSPLGGELPRDRSSLYSFIIRWIAVPLHSRDALVLAQTVAGVIAAVLVFVIVRKLFLLSFRASLVAALAVCLLPNELFYERMVMAESFGGLLLLTFAGELLAMREAVRRIGCPSLPRLEFPQSRFVSMARSPF